MIIVYISPVPVLLSDNLYHNEVVVNQCLKMEGFLKFEFNFIINKKLKCTVSVSVKP